MSVFPGGRCRRAGFTLVEVMVSMVIVVLLLLALVSITDSTRRIWTNTTNKVAEFQDAREAYEAITRRLAEATLNTYLDYEYAAGTTRPSRYARQSELRFISGTASSLLTTGYKDYCPTHAVFFQAPLGTVSNSTYANLNKLLNTCGYFIQYGDDDAMRPQFIRDRGLPKSYRFRLMELVEPSESLTVYSKTSNNASYAGTEWFNIPLGATAAPVQVRADNIVALVILPKLTPQEDSTGIRLSPNYTYDSTVAKADAAINSKNQLPPVVQVTMVAVDEPSFKRLQPGATMPDLYTTGQFTQASLYSDDLTAFQRSLQDRKLNYRVFTTNVSVRGAKWSRLQEN